jgi:hypothetical protein
MFDTFQAHQFYKKFPFTFQAKRFEIWQDGEMVKNGNTSNRIVAEVQQEANQNEVVSVKNSDTLLFSEITDLNSFDTVFTLQDRIIIVTIPEPSNRDNVGIMSLRTTSGVTRPGKIFNSNEPFCCSLFLTNKKISKVTFSFSNPEKLIEFYSDNSLSQDASPTATIENLSEHILSDIKTGNFSSVKQNMLSLYSQIIANPALIGQTNTPDKLGKAFVLMLSNRISSDDDIIESIACIAYVLVSKAIILNPTPNNYLDRLLIMQFSREQFNYSIQSALDVSEGDSDDFFSPVGQMGGTKARDEIFKMEIADLYSNPVLYQQLDLIKRKKEEFDDMIADNFFYNMTLPLLIEEGKANHEKAYNYFQNKIIINQDINV